MSNAQTSHSKESAVEYLKNYYSEFQTGYDFDGEYNAITDNYKVEINDSLFTLFFDTFNNNNISERTTISFNFKDIIVIEPSGMAFVEVVGENYGIPVNGMLSLKTLKEEYTLNIYYEVDEDVTHTDIYKAFENLMNFYKNKK
jgi:hypothetical protein